MWGGKEGDDVTEKQGRAELFFEGRREGVDDD